ncbi:hypothetical protein HOY82DRAFT_671002 [Tuber indicum]|nr:hypothetical protein HOY82DRAFT_671002 [Tuber indicum]
MIRGVGPAGGTGEADYFGGGMDEDIFREEVTEDDYVFFGSNPRQLEGFMGGGGGVGDVDMALDTDFWGGGTVDLAKESPGVTITEDMLTLDTLGMPTQNMDQAVEESGAVESRASDKAFSASYTTSNSFRDENPTEKCGVHTIMYLGQWGETLNKQLDKEQNMKRKWKRGGSMFAQTAAADEAAVPEVAEVVLRDEDTQSWITVMEQQVIGADRSEFYSVNETSSESDTDDKTDHEEEEPRGGAYFTSLVALAYGNG